MDKKSLIRVDGIKWWMFVTDDERYPIPLCPQHNLRLAPVIRSEHSSVRGRTTRLPSSRSLELECAEDGGHFLKLPREFANEKAYVINRVDALVFSNWTVLNLDDESIPVAEEELKDKNSPYWVKAKVTESKSGLRLVVWAGDRSKKSKTQLFVEPELKRLSFDQNDDQPVEVFAKVEATFKDNVVGSIQKTNKNNSKTPRSKPSGRAAKR